MNLHSQAREDVQRLLALYGPWLSRYRGCIDRFVQEVGGYWEAPEHPDFACIDPCTRTAHVRTLVGAVVSRWPVRGGSLRVKVTQFSGLHLFTGDGQRIRTRTRPRNFKTGLPMRATDEWVISPLFGHDPTAQPYEISVLLDIDPGTKTLYMASLAAIDWGEDNRGREIYYEEQIPPPAMTGSDDSGSGGSPGGAGSDSPSSLDDDFRDFLGDGEGVSETDPA